MGNIAHDFYGMLSQSGEWSDREELSQEVSECADREQDEIHY